MARGDPNIQRPMTSAGFAIDPRGGPQIQYPFAGALAQRGGGSTLGYGAGFSAADAVRRLLQGSAAFPKPIPMPRDLSNDPNVNVYQGLQAFKPLYIHGDALNRWGKLRGTDVGPGGDPLADLNARAMAVLGLRAPQSQTTGQGFGFGGSSSDLMRRLLQARYGGGV